VRVDHLHPRALLTPFTDNVDLTNADREVYTAQATAQRSKGFENVDVTFGSPPHRDENSPDTPAAEPPGTAPPSHHS
jgi:membrane protein